VCGQRRINWVGFVFGNRPGHDADWQPEIRQRVAKPPSGIRTSNRRRVCRAAEIRRGAIAPPKKNRIAPKAYDKAKYTLAIKPSV
jgi:hypothetical protein